MYSIIKELLLLLSPKQIKQLIYLQILVIFMALAEVIGITAIGPFMALIGDVHILEGDNILGKLYLYSHFTNTNDFIFWSGIAVLCVLLISALISMFTIWRLTLFGTSIGIEIGDRLFRYYLYQPWLFHASGSSAQLTKQIANDANSMGGLIIQPLLIMNSKIVLAVFISASVFALNPKVALLGVTIFGISYFTLYRLVRFSLAFNGEALSQAANQRFKVMSEGFGGIKDVLLLNRQKEFIEQFEESGKRIAFSHGTNQSLIYVPRYFIELIVFSTIIALVLFLIKTYEGNLAAVLPILSIYALAGFKLLPAFQQIYIAISSFKSGLPSYECIRKDLLASHEQKICAEMETKDSALSKISVKHSISLVDIEFSYPQKEIPALKDLTMEIPVHHVIGLVGSTGSGKSTTIDLLLGLIQAQKGSLLIDGKPLQPNQIRAWQNTLGFVPQSIFLADSSIIENIAFGLPLDNIDMTRIHEVVKLSHLEELVNQLPDGLNTRVGERGVQLSGGQRQRIGIARSLYNDAEVLILDEATSALDGITEKFIMDAIHDFSGSKTIIMIAHRFTTIEKCNIIYFMEQGRVTDKGTYADLMARNLTFRKMATHT